ncbi:Conserved_hypothetical protein [Hexamita inflata]|uniref:Uncharacterized protein n=1 Tax=Hexamita inflata TaxID=28002 RepID=A0AA86NT65_9EUKA|nr:Conserved hypothetical protein [Hexamita inflata]
MLINVTPTEIKQTFYFECTQSDSTEHVTRLALQLHNYVQYLTKMQDLLKDLSKHGQLREPESRGLDEKINNEEFGPDQDKEKYRDGFKPNERGQELLQQCDQEITKISKTYPTTRTPIQMKDLDNIMDIIKGSIMIIYPQGLKAHESLKEAIEQKDDYVNGQYNDDGFFNVESGTVFFANKSLTQRGETMKCLNAPESSTIKVIPSKSQSYAPRSHQDQNQAEMMRYLYTREAEKKKAELMTEDDVYSREWADGNSLKKQFHGMGDVKFK